MNKANVLLSTRRQACNSIEKLPWSILRWNDGEFLTSGNIIDERWIQKVFEVDLFVLGVEPGISWRPQRERNVSPCPTIPTPIENAITMLVVAGSKIEREPARRIGHQNNGCFPKHSFSFLGTNRFSAASTRFSNTFLEVLLPLLCMAKCRAATHWLNARPKLMTIRVSSSGLEGRFAVLDDAVSQQNWVSTEWRWPPGWAAEIDQRCDAGEVSGFLRCVGYL